MDPRVFVFTNDRHLWLLRPFAYLFGVFWPEQYVTVVGYNEPAFDLPSTFTFISLGPQLPVERWSDGIRIFLENHAPDRFIMMLEDYWLRKPVDRDLVAMLFGYMEDKPEVLRIDLSADRHSKRHREVEIVEGAAIIETVPPAKYQMSFQAAIWDRVQMHDALIPGESPWQAELNGTKRLNRRPDVRVLGTDRRPLNYQPVYRGKRGSLQTSKIPPAHVDLFRRRGWLKGS